jgi:excisionase family DNA binding protein
MLGNDAGMIVGNPPYIFTGHVISKAEPFQIMRSDLKKPNTSRRLGPPNPQAKFFSPKQAADWLGVSRSTVDRMITDGELKAVLLRHGKRKRLLGIDIKDLERLKKKG